MNCLSPRLFMTVIALATIGGCESPDLDRECMCSDPFSESSDSINTPSAPTLGYEFDRKFTDGDLALQNLSSQVSALLDGKQIDLYRNQAVSLLLLRSRFAGSYEDLTTALALSDSPTLIEAHSDVLGALHRFSEASQLTPTPLLSVAQGRITEEMIRTQSATAMERGTYSQWVDLATMEASAGLFERADSHFVKAIQAYRDASPFPVAWIQFQRGVMWGESYGRSDFAEPLYEEAIRLVPNYVTAKVHLSELLVEKGQTARALRLLRSVEDATDPEPRSRLIPLVSAEEAATLRAQVASDYDALLQKHPEAFADHASEFFSAEGDDLVRAFELTQLNLANRKTPRAYLLAINASIAIDADTRSLIAEAERLAPRHPVLAKRLCKISEID